MAMVIFPKINEKSFQVRISDDDPKILKGTTSMVLFRDSDAFKLLPLVDLNAGKTIPELIKVFKNDLNDFKEYGIDFKKKSIGTEQMGSFILFYAIHTPLKYFCKNANDNGEGNIKQKVKDNPILSRNSVSIFKDTVHTIIAKVIDKIPERGELSLSTYLSLLHLQVLNYGITQGEQLLKDMLIEKVNGISPITTNEALNIINCERLKNIIKSKAIKIKSNIPFLLEHVIAYELTSNNIDNLAIEKANALLTLLKELENYQTNTTSDITPNIFENYKLIKSIINNYICRPYIYSCLRIFDARN